jgi:hypothetical protein
MSEPAQPPSPPSPPPAPLPLSSKLTQEQKAKVEKWFSTFPAPHNAHCSICDAQNWMLLDDFVMPTNYYPGAGLVVGGGMSYPHFMLACGNCGNVHFINAVLTGIIPRGK